jgi:hypothetical protein
MTKAPFGWEHDEREIFPNFVTSDCPLERECFEAKTCAEEFPCPQVRGSRPGFVQLIFRGEIS